MTIIYKLAIVSLSPSPLRAFTRRQFCRSTRKKAIKREGHRPSSTRNHQTILKKCRLLNLRAGERGWGERVGLAQQASTS